MNSTDKIASSLDKIARNGIIIHVDFPAETDKFVTDLPAKTLADAINGMTDAMTDFFRSCDEMFSKWRGE